MNGHFIRPSLPSTPSAPYSLQTRFQSSNISQRQWSVHQRIEKREGTSTITFQRRQQLRPDSHTYRIEGANVEDCQSRKSENQSRASLVSTPRRYSRLGRS
ncbi:hypothetical protein BDZ97DRAFT_1819089 [Flammula alnicola]|nr:hypothetical protein BDZ97DRAFT_1819089 [Flammula alnicola]